MVVAAIKGVPLDPTALYEQIIRDRDHPQPLTVQAETIYRLPAPRPIQRFVFAPDMLDERAGLKLIEEQGAWKTGGFQALLDVPPPIAEIEPVVALRPGHLALVLAAGVADGAVIETPSTVAWHCVARRAMSSRSRASRSKPIRTIRNGRSRRRRSG